MRCARDRLSLIFHDELLQYNHIPQTELFHLAIDSELGLPTVSSDSFRSLLQARYIKGSCIKRQPNAST